MNRVLPVVGSFGRFEFSAPFDTMGSPNLEYTCQAVRRISEFIGNNENAWDIAYAPYSIPEAIYREDVIENAYIAVLQSGKGHWLYVPYRYILSYPAGDGIPYQSKTLAFALPSVPDELDLKPLLMEIGERIKGALGTEVTGRITLTSKVTLVPRELHLQKVSERALRRTGAGLYQSVARLEAENASLRQKLAQLEAYIIAKDL